MVKISDYTSTKGKILVDEELFKGGSDPLNLQLGMVTGFDEPVYRKIVIQEKTQCEASRQMKRNTNSKCTIDEEEDGSNEERAKECSSMEPCYDKGYKNSMCPDDHHCAYWKLPSGKLYAGCVISKYCFKY